MIYKVYTQKQIHTHLDSFFENDIMYNMYMSNDPTLVLEIGVAERIVDNIKYQFTKDKQDIIKKYNEEAQNFNEYKKEIEKFKNNKSAFGGVLLRLKERKYSFGKFKEIEFVSDVYNIEEVLSELKGLSPDEKNNYIKGLERNYSDLKGTQKIIHPEIIRGDLYAVLKSMSLYLSNTKKMINNLNSICQKQIDSISKSMQYIDQHKDDPDVKKYGKRIINVQKMLYNRNCDIVMITIREIKQQSNMIKAALNDAKRKANT